MKKLTPIKQYLLGFGLILLALLIAVLTIFYLAMKPRLDAEKQATNTAITYGKLTETSNVDLYNGKSSYYSIYGKTASGESEIVTVGEKNGEVYINDLSKGISKKEAETVATENGASSVTKVVFGIYDKMPIWEVEADNGYYLVDFETRELIKKEGL